jgi:hypothetical protein
VDRSLAPLTRVTDLDEWLALLQVASGFWKAREQDSSQPCIRGIAATRHPQNLGRRTEPLQEQDKITVLTHDHCPSLPCGVKDRQVFGVSEPQVTHGMRSHSKGVAKPACQRGRQLRINLEDHATTTG